MIFRLLIYKMFQIVKHKIKQFIAYMYFLSFIHADILIIKLVY